MGHLWNWHLKVQVIVACGCSRYHGDTVYHRHATKIGKAMRAVSEDKDTAALMGIDVNRIIVSTFAIGAAMAGAAGVLYALIFVRLVSSWASPRASKPLPPPYWVASATSPAPCLGGMVLGHFESVGPALFLDGLGIPRPYQLKDAIAYTMLVMILLFRPSGILGERLTSKKA
jgi:branched-chain amino acid transport system permease protein